MINFLSLFSGIGAFEKALDRLGVEYNLVNYCEIDKYASKSYSAVHNVSESLNLGDVTKIDTSKLPCIDMISYGFPCQDISLAGKQQGLFNDDGTHTRSGLFFEALRIIEATKPKVAIAENVKNLVSKKFNAQFQIVLESLDQAGYNNYWKVLNAKDYGIPQNRERVFIVSIRKDVDIGSFKFPKPFELELRLKDLLESEVDEKYFMSEKSIGYVCATGTKNFHYEPEIDLEIARPLTATMHKMHRASQDNYVSEEYILHDNKAEIVNGKPVIVRENTKKGYTEAVNGDSINFEQPNSKTRRGRVGKQVAQTLTTSPQMGVVTNETKPVLVGGVGDKNFGTQYRQGNRVYDSNAVAMCLTAQPVGNAGGNSYLYKTNDLRIRKLTPLECWRLMGFDDEDFYKAEKVCSNTQLYKQAGNSIVVDVLEYLFKEILEAVDMKKVEDKVVVYECEGLINLEALKEKEPELYEELLADYPCEKATYVFKVVS